MCVVGVLKADGLKGLHDASSRAELLEEARRLGALLLPATVQSGRTVRNEPGPSPQG